MTISRRELQTDIASYTAPNAVDEKLISIGADPKIARTYFEVSDKPGPGFYAITKRVTEKIGKVTPERLLEIIRNGDQTIEKKETDKGVVIFDLLDNSPFYGATLEKDMDNLLYGTGRDDPFKSSHMTEHLIENDAERYPR